MRLGIAGGIKRRCPEEWAKTMCELGCGAIVFPCSYRSPDAEISAYVNACREYDLVIAEVGAWSNLMHPDKREQAKNMEDCKMQLRLADEVEARCCVNIAGACGEIWDGGYVENYSPDTYQRTLDTIREILDDVNPKHTCYTLEPMPWMLPDGPDSYLQLISDINHPAFAVHMDIVNMISSPERYFFNAKFAEDCFSKLGPHTKSCHVKDVRLERFLTFNLKETACGQGNLDIARYAELANEANPEMPFIIEHLQTEEEYIASLRYLQKLIPSDLLPHKTAKNGY